MAVSDRSCFCPIPALTPGLTVKFEFNCILIDKHGVHNINLKSSDPVAELEAEEAERERAEAERKAAIEADVASIEAPTVSATA